MPTHLLHPKIICLYRFKENKNTILNFMLNIDKNIIKSRLKNVFLKIYPTSCQPKKIEGVV